MSKTKIQWLTIDGKRFLKFIFHEHLSVKEAAPALSQWRKEFEQNVSATEKVNIIWDCLDMSGFDPNVKNAWQKTLKDLHSNIADIWVLSKNPVIRVAALTMGVFSNYKIKTAVTELDIK